MENEKQQEEVVEPKVSEDVKSEETKVETPSNKNEDGDYKVDLSKPAPKPTEEKVEEKVTPVEKTEVKDTPEQEEESIIQEVTGEVEETEDVLSKVDKQQADKLDEEEPKQETPEVELPENVQELVKFMNETGGTLEDYVRLNADYSNIDNEALLREYYKSTKPHLSTEEVNFMLEDNFSYDDEADDPRDIKRKQLAHKEAVAQARNHLDGLKAQYYKELKLGSKLAPEQQKAIDFFNRYNKEQAQVSELTAKQQKHFNQKTDQVFNENFKGFDFQVGEKKYRYNVKDVQQTKDAQSDVLNVFSKYINEDNLLSDAKGYHKSLFAARNADALANHFYQQGKADAVKQLTSEAKNINVDGRKTSDGVVKVGGNKFKVISGDNSSSRKFKLKNY
jgi:hypothetical protein